MKEIQAQFLGRFSETARGRLARMRAAITDPHGAGLATVIHELHSFAGESGLLGYSQFVAIARDGEAEAKRRQAGGSADATFALDVVARLEQMLDELTAPTS
jgi:HPt (histidine-containing phosphotransfer) domain-containing protein